MAWAIRGKRVAYDNVAVGSASGPERQFGVTVSPSGYGIDYEAGGYSNISGGNRPGVEDTDNGSADKQTSDGEVV